jgi:ATP-dependent DNA helicase RecG
MTGSSQKTVTLDTPVQYVKGVGPKRAELLSRVNVLIIEDLLHTLPRRYLDRSRIAPIRNARMGEDVTVVGKILSTQVQKGRRARFIVTVGDDSGILQCVWFQGIPYVKKAFQVGETVAFSGRINYYRGPQLVHPEYDKISEKGETDPLHTGRIIPMYSSTEALARSGLDSRGFRRILKDVVNRLPDPFPESVSREIRQRQKLADRGEALRNIHFPADWESFRKAQNRLKFEELFFFQLFLALQRKRREIGQKGIAFEKVGLLTQNFVERLSFSLTEAQKRVLREIRGDMKRSRPMNRLLQGDVGSGKTVVATIAMLIAVENGYQAALMAPTEILAEQHYQTIRKWLTDLGVSVSLLKGGQKSSERAEILGKLAAGDIQVVIGTHALIQEKVNFSRLGMVVIDEQHRFGVIQRALLRRKGTHPDVLVMTATPIPRTLALTLYGDLDVSLLDEMPRGRKPVRTVWREESSRGDIYRFIDGELEKGRQAYVVYPLVEESEKVDLAAATEGFRFLSGEVFANRRVALLHGRMKSEDKEAVMTAFKSGEIQLLVCTTVVEVGVDVPNATIMLLEHAERFGLTQMHQLRGRIGRGDEQATCILLSQGKVTDDARERLRTMVETGDGFVIAEKDLQLRGPGELIGTRQHGLLDFRIADLTQDGRILEKAREEAFRLVEEDVDLALAENLPVREAYTRLYRDEFRLMNVG